MADFIDSEAEESEVSSRPVIFFFYLSATEAKVFVEKYCSTNTAKLVLSILRFE